MKKSRIAIGLVVVLVLGIGGAWASGVWSEDPRVTEIRQLQAKLASPEAEQMQDEERRELFRQMREKAEQLPKAERDQLFREGQQRFMGQMGKRLDDFFKLPVSERTAALDKIIDDQEERRKAWEAQEAEQAANQQAGAGGGGDRGPPWGRGGGTEEQRQERYRQILDHTTPQRRAQFSEFRRLMEERRKERKLPAGRSW